MHRSCFRVEDEEVKQLMAGAEESLPTREEEEEMQGVQRTTPLTAQQYYDELAYYSKIGEEMEELYRKVEVDVERIPADCWAYFPEAAVHDGKIYIYRWINSNVSMDMFRLMRRFFGCIVPKGVRTVYPVSVDMEHGNTYHIGCEEEDKENGIFTEGFLEIHNLGVEKMNEVIEEDMETFFCYGCHKYIFNDHLEKLSKREFDRQRRTIRRCETVITGYVMLDNEEINLYELKVRKVKMNDLPSSPTVLDE